MSVPPHPKVLAIGLFRAHETSPTSFQMGSIVLTQKVAESTLAPNDPRYVDYFENLIRGKTVWQDLREHKTSLRFAKNVDWTDPAQTTQMHCLAELPLLASTSHTLFWFVILAGPVPNGNAYEVNRLLKDMRLSASSVLGEHLFTGDPNETVKMCRPALDQLVHASNNLGDEKVQRVQKEVQAIADTMRHNIDIVIARGDQLSDLEEKSTGLEQEASKFRLESGKLSWQKRCQKYKTTCLVIWIVLVLLTIIIAPIVVHSTN